jgi:hypothetical protein
MLIQGYLHYDTLDHCQFQRENYRTGKKTLSLQKLSLPISDFQGSFYVIIRSASMLALLVLQITFCDDSEGENLYQVYTPVSML